MYGRNQDEYGAGDPGQGGWQRVSSSAIDARVSFIRKTYAHLVAAILAFVGLEVGLFASGAADWLVGMMTMGGQLGWLVVLGLFMVVGWVADWWAHNTTSRAMQYLGLGLYVAAEAVIFVPLLAIAAAFSGPAVIPTAGILTAVVFAGLTVFVFATKKDLSFLRGALAIAGLMALGLIICAAIFGFSLGLWFSVAMVGLASGYILYQTSNVIHHYDTNQYVAASLALFASVALLFWYILRILMSLSRD